VRSGTIIQRYKRVFSHGTVISFGIFIFAFLLFLFYALQIISGNDSNFDQVILQYLDRLESDGHTRIARIFTFFGTGTFLIPVYLFIAICCARTKRVIIGIMILELALGSAVFGAIMKEIFKRPRPLLKYMDSAGGFSFPSGHSLGAFTLCGILVLILWESNCPKFVKWILFLVTFLFSILVGLSRVYLHVHYASDVIGSFCVSVLWFALYCFYVQLIDGAGKSES